MSCKLLVAQRLARFAPAAGFFGASRGARAWHAALALCCGLSLSIGCARSTTPVESTAEAEDETPKLLSSYGLWKGNGATQEPVEGVIPYDLNSALFSDYMWKYRFVKLPPGTSAVYHGEFEFEFPVGTIIAKTFACPVDIRDPEQGRRLIETRLLVHKPEGWVGLPYIWNAEQTEATLKIIGATQDLRWVHYDGEPRENNYIIPNKNQCKGCHKSRSKVMLPIGPKARHLNRDFAYAHGTENQLAYWTRVGALKGAPQPSAAPRAAVWDDPTTGTLDERARAWLDVNCAHCHNTTGPARNSGLDLTYNQVRPYQFGVYRAPVASGSGSGGMLYDIVPAKPEESILVHRISSTHPGVMMPELGKRMVHDEAVALIREWVTAMPPTAPGASGR